MKLLLLNSFKGLKKKKIQMLAIILMVLLSTGIYTAMNSALDRLEDRYYYYLKNQNVEDFSFNLNLKLKRDLNKETYQQLKQNELKNVPEASKAILTSFEQCFFTSTCNETILTQVTYLFDQYGVTERLLKDKLGEMALQYDFSYEKQLSKTLTENQYLYKAIPYSKDQKINQPYLVEGNFPKRDNEITVLPGFAKANHLVIGDSLTIGKTSYKIVGYAYAADHIYPMVSFNQPIFDEKYNNVIFMNEESFASFGGVLDTVYSSKFNYFVDPKGRLENSMTDMMTEEKEGVAKNPGNTVLRQEKDYVYQNASTMSRMMRIDMLQLEFATNRKFAEYFLYLLLGVSVFIIMVVTKKRIDDERLQIGVLKSLGYKAASIAVSYLVYPILGALIGGTLGFAIGISSHTWLTNIYLSYFNVPLGGYAIHFQYLAFSIFVPMIVLTILSYLIAIYMLRKRPLSLLKEGSNLKVNFFSKMIGKLTKPLPFNYRFKYSLASRSLGKLFIVSLTSFCTGLLIVLVLIGSNLFESMIDKSFEGMSYQYMVTYASPQVGEVSEKEDLILQARLNILKVEDKNGKEKKLEKKDQSLSMTGIDQETNYLKVLDKKQNNIIPLLKDDHTMIISQNVAEIMKVVVGDTITVGSEELKIAYKVVGIAEEYTGFSGYVDREELSSETGSPKMLYNTKYSNEDKYGNMSELEESELKQINSIFSFADLKRNIEKQMETMNGSIYIVIAFASFMALVIIAVIANIVVEENKKIISLMKVMGYQNKQVSSIVLNIYTPFVIVAYLLSIPAMISLLKWIIGLLTSDINMAIPITLSPLMALLGLVGLLAAYYIAIALSRRVLNKVPLAVALKRE